MTSLDQFISKYTGKFVEYHSYNPAAKNQCTDLVNQWITEGLGLTPIIGTNAQDFPSKKGKEWKYILNTPTGVPQKGDLMIFKSADKVGHISIFVEGNASSFRSFDQNYPTGSACKIVSHNYRNVLGWMRPVKGTMATVQLDTKKFEELVSKSTSYDEFVKAGFKSANEVSIRIKELEKALAQKPVEIIKEVVITKEVPVEIIKEIVVTQPNDTLGALQLITLTLKAILAGRW